MGICESQTNVQNSEQHSPIPENISFNGQTKYGSFQINTFYADCITIKWCIEDIIFRLEQKHQPKRFMLDNISPTSFTGCNEYSVICNNPITEYSKDEILEKGLYLNVEIKFEHRIRNQIISCNFMKEKNTENPMQCPIYKSIKKRHQFDEKQLVHIQNYNHFKTPLEEKPECKQYEHCNAFQRLENGEHKTDDLCHVHMYRHPPRQRNLQLQQNIHAMVLNKNKRWNNHAIYTPIGDPANDKYSGKDWELKAFTDEIILNGYKYDLCLICKKDDECKHDECSIFQIVDRKIKHQRHLMMGSPLNKAEMLALILYTGCDCNYDLCAAQRNGNYKKWKWF
eukprot:246132_1